MKLSKPLEDKVKEEIFEEVNKRLGSDIDINDKKISVAGAIIKLDLFIDLDTEG